MILIGVMQLELKEETRRSRQMRKEENVGEGGWSTGKINLHSLCASHTVASSNGRADYLTAIVSRATDDQKYLSPGK